MIDAGIAAGIATGVAAEQGNKLIRQVWSEEENADPDLLRLLAEQRDLLRIIAERQSNQLTPAENDTVPIFPFPGQYRVPDYKRQHFSMFLGSGYSGQPGAYTPTVTTAKFYFEIPGVGVHIKTLSPGWNQLDLPPQTAISSADGNNYNVIVSFRDDAIGAAL